jgi:hypothetical protein
MVHARSYRNFEIYDEQFQRLSCWSMPTGARGCRQDEIPLELNDRLSLARRQQLIARGGYIIGASLVTTGAVLLYLNRPRPAEQGARRHAGGGVAVVPAVSGDSFGIVISVIR